MKGKRFAALFLTLAMVFSLTAAPASAAAFDDISGHWAKVDIETMAERKVVNGVGSGKFAPDRKMTACEALLFCSRTTGVTAADKARIAADRAEQLKRLLPEDMYPWAYAEMAVCLETGIITEEELDALNTSGAIRKTISREKLAMYLTRAMQLAAVAQGLSSVSLPFADTASIDSDMKPFVYLLNMYGIIKGNQKNEFMPQGSLTRAEMTTMLRRAMDFMAERGIFAELPAYTDGPWVGGRITAVSTGAGGVELLTLELTRGGSQTVSLPAEAVIYRSNMKGDVSDLKAGDYVRVNLDSRGAAESVRIGGPLQTYSGPISRVDSSEVTLEDSGVSRTFRIDRFTEVQVNGATGGAELIDLKAGYTAAVCQVDHMGHLAAVTLTGGSHQEEGLLSGVTLEEDGSATIQVSAFNGAVSRYRVPAGAGITVNGVAGRLMKNYAGCGLTMRVSNEDTEQVLAANVDTVTRYAQGSILRYTTAKAVNTVTLQDLDTGHSTEYDLAPGAEIRFNGEKIPLQELKKDSFATLRLTGNEISLADTYPGAVVTRGEIESIVYGAPITLNVRQENGSVLTCQIPLDDLPVIYRGEKLSSIDHLKTGDTVEVTVRFSRVSQISATARNANVTGTITKLVQDSAGVTIEVRDAEGTTGSYILADSVTVTREGAVSTAYSLRIHDQVALVVTGGEVVSVEVSKSASTGTSMVGTVLTKNNQNNADRSFLLLLEDGNVVTVEVGKTSFVDTDGSDFSYNGLKGGDTITVYGSYSGARFRATLIVRS